jgi:hypothetical protein
MLKDRSQKALALRLSISKRWLPQLEVEVEPSRRLDRAKALLTDIDVLSITQSAISGHERIVFDCKSGAKESGIGRSFWLHGVMARVGAKHGFVVLPEKATIVHDHRISAADLNVSLMHDSEVEGFARSIGGTTVNSHSLVGDIDTWEHFLAISLKYPSLAQYLGFSRSGFWMIKDPGERCRRSISRLRAIHSELDPSKPEHMAVFGDAVCLFLVAVSELAGRALLILLRPASKDDFASTVLAMLYGGYENLEAAQKLRRLASGAAEDEKVSIFPELARFEQLIREVMQAPLDALPAAILARELSFEALLQNSSTSQFQATIASEARYSAKFLVLASEYLQKTARLPPEFSEFFTGQALGLSSTYSLREGI